MDFVEIRDRGKIGKAAYALKEFSGDETVLFFQGAETPTRGMHTLQVGLSEHLLVDAPGRYVNHSCAPNCGIKGTRQLVAMRPIARGEEIVFDYAMTESHLSPGALDCACGEPQCRRRITGFSGLPSALKEKYRGYLSDYLSE